jgi:CheY-like chemotaxis protein
MPRKAILLIDDNAINLRIAELTLQLGGFNVRGVSTALAALQILGGWTPDAILVDLRMPGMDGMAFIKALRSGAGTRGVPVIAMSAYDAPHPTQLEKLGFSGFIGKPMSPREFCQQVNRFLGDPAAGVASVAGAVA